MNSRAVILFACNTLEATPRLQHFLAKVRREVQPIRAIDVTAASREPPTNTTG
jgi:hypothetical protein